MHDETQVVVILSREHTPCPGSAFSRDPNGAKMDRDMGELATDLVGFYAANGSENVRPCPMSVVLPCVEAGHAYTFRSYSSKGMRPLTRENGTNIVCASMVFMEEPSEVRSRIVPRTYAELGATVSRERGFGHQWSATAVRWLDVLIRHPKARPYGYINIENHISLRGTIKAREAIVPRISKDLSESKRRQFPELTGQQVWTVPSIETVKLAAIRVQQLRTGLGFRKPRDRELGDERELTVSVVLGDAFDADWLRRIDDIIKASPSNVADLGRVMHGDPSCFIGRVFDEFV